MLHLFDQNRTFKTPEAVNQYAVTYLLCQANLIKVKQCRVSVLSNLRELTINTKVYNVIQTKE